MNEQNEPQYISTNVLPTSTLAIVSVIAGVLSFSILPLVAAIVAIITGYMARKETRATPPTASGDGLATAGIILGYVHIVLFVLVFCCLIAYFAAAAGWIFTSQS